MGFEYYNDFFNKKDKCSILRSNDDNTLMHTHSFFELVYVVNGSARHITDTNTTTITKGDYFIIDLGSNHKYEKINTDKFEIVNCLFVPEIIDKALTQCESFQKLINNYLINFNYFTLEKIPTNYLFYDESAKILSLLEKIEKEYHGKNQGYIEVIRCYLIEIIIFTMRKISKINNTSLSTNNEHIKFLKSYIDENYMNKISMTELCKALNYSLPYISKKFKDEMGISFNSYLQKLRIEQSCRMLKNTNESIDSIATIVGYNDAKFFREVFKKYMGLTPREFKKIDVR